MIKIYWEGVIDLQKQLNKLQELGIKRSEILDEKVMVSLKDSEFIGKKLIKPSLL